MQDQKIMHSLHDAEYVVMRHGSVCFNKRKVLEIYAGQAQRAVEAQADSDPGLYRSGDSAEKWLNISIPLLIVVRHTEITDTQVHGVTRHANRTRLAGISVHHQQPLALERQLRKQATQFREHRL